MSILSKVILFLFLLSSLLFSQSRQNLIKVATIDMDFIMEKLKEDNTLVKVLTEKTKPDFKEVQQNGITLSNLKRKRDGGKLSTTQMETLELEIFELERSLVTYFSRVSTPSITSVQTLTAIYYYVRSISIKQGVSLLLEKNYGVIFAEDNADITLSVWHELLKEKIKMGL